MICNEAAMSMKSFLWPFLSYIVQLNNEQRDLFRRWVTLTDHQKELIYQLILEMK